MAQHHTGWMVTDDLRGVPVEESNLGAVSPTMTPEAYVRLADAASRSELDLTPMMHRITPKGAGSVERFLRDPRLLNARGGAAGRALAPVLGALGQVMAAVRWGARTVRNSLTGATRTRRGLDGRARGFPHQRQPDAKPRNPATGQGQPTEERPGFRRDRGPAAEAQQKTVNPETAMWERSHSWRIVDAGGAELYRGESIGVEGDAPEAVRARRAPLDQIPGLPRNARIEWQGQPDWNAQGVSVGGAARSVAYIASERMRASWSDLRSMGEEIGAVTRGDRPTPAAQAAPESQPTRRSAYDDALERMRARHRPSETGASESLTDLIERLRKRVNSEGDAPKRQRPEQETEPPARKKTQEQRQRNYDSRSPSQDSPSAGVHV